MPSMRSGRTRWACWRGSKGERSSPPSACIRIPTAGGSTTGELIGPDPEIERPATEEELAQALPFVDARPELAAGVLRERPDLAGPMEETRRSHRERQGLAKEP